MISLSKTPNGTLLTIGKYSFFQLGRDTNKDTDKDTPKDTDKDADKDETRINKNYIKNEKEITGAAGSAFSSERE
jgi:hypothetical protein